MILASLGEQEMPLASYAPFLHDDRYFYLFLSQLADHTKNLVNHSSVSALFIADESESEEIFARTRVQYSCDVETMDKNLPAGQIILDQLTLKYGDTFKMIRVLPDFILFRLSPTRGSFVEGFARASELPAFEKLTKKD